jgi:hypothetical protein
MYVISENFLFVSQISDRVNHLGLFEVHSMSVRKQDGRVKLGYRRKYSMASIIIWSTIFVLAAKIFRGAAALPAASRSSMRANSSVSRSLAATPVAEDALDSVRACLPRSVVL